MDIAARIRFFREQKGYTVNKLANLAGVSQSYLRSIELGDKNPTVETLSTLCWALDISLRDFSTTQHFPACSRTSFFTKSIVLQRNSAKHLRNF